MQLALYKGTRGGLAGVYNRLVRWIEGGPYSHCELVFASGMAASASWMDGGVRLKRIDFDPSRWDLVELSNQLDEEAALAWFEQRLGARYDLAGNIRFVLTWWPHSRTRWFCSEAIGAALGVPSPEDFGPNGLYRLAGGWKEQTAATTQ